VGFWPHNRKLGIISCRQVAHTGGRSGNPNGASKKGGVTTRGKRGKPNGNCLQGGAGGWPGAQRQGGQRNHSQGNRTARGGGGLDVVKTHLCTPNATRGSIGDDQVADNGGGKSKGPQRGGLFVFFSKAWVKTRKGEQGKAKCHLNFEGTKTETPKGLTRDHPPPGGERCAEKGRNSNARQKSAYENHSHKGSQVRGLFPNITGQNRAKGTVLKVIIPSLRSEERKKVFFVGRGAGGVTSQRALWHLENEKTQMVRGEKSLEAREMGHGWGTKCNAKKGLGETKTSYKREY